MTKAHRLITLAGVASMLAAATPFGAVSFQTPPPAHRVSSLEIRILSTMLADQGFGEWGFAAIVEADGRRVLFDTGAHADTVQRNLKAYTVSRSSRGAAVSPAPR